MTIRTKLLLVMGGLLVASSTLSLALHLRESRRLDRRLEQLVEQVVDRVVAEHQPGGHLGPRPGELAGRLVHRVIPRVIRSPGRIQVVLEHRTDVLPRDGEWPPEGAPARAEVIPEPLETALRDDFVNPVSQVRAESVPRELLIAGGVLLAGLVMTGLLAGRMSRPVKELTRKMERVAAGDLSARVEPTTRDEVRQMGLAFNTMVDRLRETRELERKVARAERLSALGTLAAGVAHDVRNPLHAIGLTLGHLRERYAPEEPVRRDRYHEHLDDVRSELERLEGLVRNFLCLARPDAGEREACDLKELAGETLRLFSKEAERQAVRIDTALEDVPPVMVQPNQVRMALTNLLVNALHAMEGGGTLRVEVARSAGGEPMVRVEDTGPGMTESELERAFVPYWTTRDDGTGLGLPVARSAVEANGGRLELRSRPDEGLVAEIVLPYSSEASRAEPLDPPDAPAGAPATQGPERRPV